MSATPSPLEEHRPAYTVAGFLSAMAIFAALIGLAWHPLRLIAPAIILSMIVNVQVARLRNLGKLQ